MKSVPWRLNDKVMSMFRSAAFTPAGAALFGLVRELEALRVPTIGRVSPGRAALLRWFGAHGPATVSDAARGRGGSRQASQRLADDLVAEGWLERQPNPAHRRAPRFALTSVGRDALAEIEARETGFVNGWAEGLDPAVLHAARRLLAELRRRGSAASDQALASGGAGRTSPS